MKRKSLILFLFFSIFYLVPSYLYFWIWMIGRKLCWKIFFLHFRVTIAYFSVAGLDVLGSISAISLDLRSRIIEWLYRLQVHPDKESKWFIHFNFLKSILKFIQFMTSLVFSRSFIVQQDAWSVRWNLKVFIIRRLCLNLILVQMQNFL